MQSAEGRLDGEQSESEARKTKQRRHLYKYITTTLKSRAPKDPEKYKCLVRFHNCTPHRVSLFWIDFGGRAIKYPTLNKGATINLDTYISHLWYFKIEDPKCSGTVELADLFKVLAIPEDAITVSHAPAHQISNDLEQDQALCGTITAPNNILICSLCKYLLKSHSVKPHRVPCPHFTGEVKFSVSDIENRCRSSFNSSYIYSCNESTHCSEHSRRRRNIYLVKPFLNLKERCFLTVRNRIKISFDVVDLNLPASLQEDFLMFVTSLNKLKE